MNRIISFFVLAGLSLNILAQTTYAFDKNHARLTFSVVHMGISQVEGYFKDFNAGLVSSKEDFSDAVITMTAQTKSVDTNVEPRDNDLRGDKWFDSEKFPEIDFKGTSFRKIDEKNYILIGNFTMHGVTKPVELAVVFNGKTQNPYSKKYIVGFTVSGKLNRSDFKVGGAPAVTGVGEEIEIKSNVEFVLN